MAEISGQDLSPFALKADLPLPAQTMPPGVEDSGAKGSSPRFALADHTHASKVRKARIQSSAAGVVSWTFDPPFAEGVQPRVIAMAETGAGVTDVVNVQIEGQPTNTGCTLRVTRSSRTTLLGNIVGAIISPPGATWVHAIAAEH